MKKHKTYIVLIMSLIVISFQACNQNPGIRVSKVEEFNTAMENANPGDEIILEPGIWDDAELVLNAKGTKEKPIRITAGERHKVIFSGLSNMRISGEFLEISGFVFKNGYTPTSEVISFREKKGSYANHCRLTDCIIDNYNNPERFAVETWLALYGQHNRVDHCMFIGKRTSGVCLVVRLIDEKCQENYHTIDHNYFGYRQTMGSNGGETMRIGTSKYSLTTSGTNVEANYFDRCGGEVEIISSKSCGNTFKNNTFFECRGTLTFRHGNDNLAEGNFFLGNEKDYTGGIRIINKRNKAINNYLYGLKGYRFGGALVIMNGIPNSPINRYHQVVEGIFSNNSFINCDHIQLCAGSDEERSLPPADSKIENNIFYRDSPGALFTVYDDISGIEFKHNFANDAVEIPADIKIEKADFKLLKNESGIWIPEPGSVENAGCSLESPVATKENTIIEGYEPEEVELIFDKGSILTVDPGLNSLADAVSNSAPGDILLLSDGEYVNTKEIFIKHPLTIKAKNKGNTTLLSEKKNMFTIENQGALKLSAVMISGSSSPDNSGNSIISTSKYSMNRNYKLIVEDCLIRDLDVNHSFDFLKVYKNTFADTIMFKNCEFKNVSGNIAALNKETDDLGIYNAEYVIYQNTSFEDIGGSVLDLYRGGTDESTFGPILQFEKCLVKNSGFDKRNKTGSSLSLHGVQKASIMESSFLNSADFKLHLTENGDPVTRILNVNIFPKAGIVSNSEKYTIENLMHKEL